MDLIDAETLRRTGGFEAFPGRSAVAIEYSPDGRRLAVAGEVAASGVWDAGSGSESARSCAPPAAPRSGQPAHRPGARLRPGRAARRGGGGGRRADLGPRRARSCFGRRCACLRRARPGLQPGRLAARDPVRCGLRGSRRRRDSRRRQAADGSPGCRPTARSAGRLLPRRRPARGWPARRRRAPLGDRRLAAGGAAAGSREAPPWRWTSPRTAARWRPRTPTARSCSGTSARSSRSARPLRLPAAARDSYVTARFTPDGDRLFAVSDAGTRDPLGGRSRGLACNTRAPSPVATSRPSSGKRSCPSRTTSRSAPRADDIAPADHPSGRVRVDAHRTIRWPECSHRCSHVVSDVFPRPHQRGRHRSQTAENPARRGFSCAQGDSNSHGPNGPQGPQPCASTSSATGA